MILPRILVVLAAVFFVTGAALASLGGPSMPLIEAVGSIDHDWITWLDANKTRWISRWVIGPLLVRPAWLLPVALAVIAIGLAASVNSMRGTPLRRKG